MLFAVIGYLDVTSRIDQISAVDREKMCSVRVKPVSPASMAIYQVRCCITAVCLCEKNSKFLLMFVITWFDCVSESLASRTLWTSTNQCEEFRHLPSFPQW